MPGLPPPPGLPAAGVRTEKAICSACRTVCGGGLGPWGHVSTFGLVKLSSPPAMPPRTMLNSSQERKVRSVARATLGSTRTGTWMPVRRQRTGKHEERERDLR
jgi:hypothetical protein